MAACMGHTQYRYHWHRYRDVSCGANCVPRRTQHYTSQICSCRDVIYHCSNSVSEFADLGSSSGCDCWARRIGRNDSIGIRSIGGCAKLIYESIEEIDPKQVEAIKATGGSRAQQMVYGILPQVLPTIAGVGVFRWDINVRGSTILGIVGAGGIGIQLSASINVLAWTQ